MNLPEYVDDLPNICGSEAMIAESLSQAARPCRQGEMDWGRIKSAFAIALHMHQPLIPARSQDLRTAAIISNLKYMMDHPDVGDNHNAPVFHWCYKRMGEFIPELVARGQAAARDAGLLRHACSTACTPMGLRRRLRQPADDHLRSGVSPVRRVAGLGLGPSGGALDAGAGLPPARAGLAAPLRRDLRPRGAGPGPGVLARRDGAAQPSGRLLRVRQDAQGMRLSLGAGAGAHGRAGRGRRPRHVTRTCRTGWWPRNSRGETLGIIAIIKTQGSDTKLVGQMQPYYEAKGLTRMELAGKSVPPLVTQIADGENGGVMMNEFPPKYHAGHGGGIGQPIRRR